MEYPNNYPAFLFAMIVWIVALGVPAFAVLYAAYWFIGLPFRWLERARLFLDVIESGLSEGLKPEFVIPALSARHERAVGVKFHLLAAWIEKGLRLGPALDKVPRLLPVQVTALLKIGEECGDLRRLLPAGRKVIADATNQARNPREAVVGLTIGTTVFIVYVVAVLNAFVFPKFEELLVDSGIAPPALFTLLHANLGWWLLAQGIFLVLVVLALMLYMGGPIVAAWTESHAPRLADLAVRCLPWRFKRLQRDFSLMLALLLEAEVPEEKAVQFAADFTASKWFKRRAALVTADLRRGVKLPEAVGHLDLSGQFTWRLAFARFGEGKFVESLEGWHLGLEARALQQEQTAAGATSLAMILFNGASVGLVAVTVFSLLLAMMEGAAPW